MHCFYNRVAFHLNYVTGGRIVQNSLLNNCIKTLPIYACVDPQIRVVHVLLKFTYTFL